MKNYKFNTLKRVSLVLLVCTTGYLLISSVISWTIKSFQRPTLNYQSKAPECALQTQSSDFKFKASDRAIFDFTGDTVLIIGAGKDYPYDEEKYWQVQIIEPNKGITKMDLPEQFLIPLEDSNNH